MGKLTFIHTADLHLDSPMLGLRNLPEHIFKELRESTFTSFTRIIDIAIKRQVDFIIIAGDLFDLEDRSVRAQIRFRKEMERLKKHEIAAYIIHGNHDHLDGRWTMIDLPENVHVFPRDLAVKKEYTKSGEVVHLYGFSYDKRHLYEDRTEQYKKEAGADYDIGILHGHPEGVSEHSRYAPFNVQELLTKQFDYWALGHIHTETILHQDPHVVFPGNIQGRHRGETGEKGCYLVTLEDGQTNLEWIPTSTVVWKNITKAGSQVSSFTELYDLCVDLLESERSNRVKQLVTFHITELENAEIIKELEKNELIPLLQEEESKEEIYIYPIRFTYAEKVQMARKDLEKKSSFYEELFQTIDTYEEIEKTLAFLYEHPRARKYLHQLTEDEEVVLLKEAEELLIKLLTTE